MALYDKSHYYVDFSDSELLTTAEKNTLEQIQKDYKPLERVDFLMEFKMMGKITTDEFEIMTGLPYNFGD